MPHSLADIAQSLGLPFRGDGNHLLTRVSSWEAADGTSVVFLEGKRVIPAPGECKIGCVVGAPGSIPDGFNAILTDKPKLAFARASALLAPTPVGRGLRHPSAIISPEAEIADEVDVGPCAVVGARARVGRGTILHAGTVIGDGCEIGENCILHPRVVLYPGAKLGSRVVLHAGVIVGGDGFGYVFDGNIQVKFPQAGSVVIDDDVEIGCNTTVDRGSLGTTRIGKGAKIDNLVQIAHNVEIGRGVVIAAQTGISGSSVIEEFAVIGGQVGFGDHTRVQAGVVIGSKAGILPGKIVRSGDVYWGVPVRPLREYKRLNALFGRLPELKADIDALKEAVSRLLALVGKQGRPNGSPEEPGASQP
jgi:UDP-3-O-[3-hydroxymyristoyl] glucosamine N-acyltransferase